MRSEIYSDINRSHGTREGGERAEDDVVVFKSSARKNRYEKKLKFRSKFVYYSSHEYSLFLDISYHRI